MTPDNELKKINEHLEELCGSVSYYVKNADWINQQNPDDFKKLESAINGIGSDISSTEFGWISDSIDNVKSSIEKQTQVLERIADVLERIAFKEEQR